MGWFWWTSSKYDANTSCADAAASAEAQNQDNRESACSASAATLPAPLPPAPRVRRPLLILALDGGGVRGALQVAILERLFARYPQLEQRIDMVAGTSAGGLLAAGLATRPFHAAKQCASQHNLEGIFQRSWLHDARAADGWYAARYTSEHLRAFIESFFGNEATVGDAQRALLLTAFRVDTAGSSDEPNAHGEPFCNADPVARHLFPAERWQPVLYHNLGRAGEGMPATRLVDALLATTAAPTVFAAHHGCVDGGVTANNPALLAAAYAVRFGLAERLDDVHVLSIGTGKCVQNMNAYGAEADLGDAQWLRPALDMLVQANAEAASLACAALLGPRFCRVQPLLHQHIALDDARAVPQLQRVGAEQNLDEAHAWISALFEL